MMLEHARYLSRSKTPIIQSIARIVVADIERHSKGIPYDTLLWQALFRGQSMACAALVEKHGIPVDVKKIKEFEHYWPKVKIDLIEKFNDKIIATSVGAKEIIKNSEVYESLEPAIKKIDYLIATTSRFRNKNLKHINLIDLTKLDFIKKICVKQYLSVTT